MLDNLNLYLKLTKYFFGLYYWEKVSKKKIEKMQLKKFREIFEYARENSRFYKEFYSKNGVIDLKIETLDDIKKIPIINKEILRKYSIEDIMTCGLDKTINVHSTSGSTGEPFKIAVDKYEDYTSHVRLTKKMFAHGFTPFKKMVLLSRYEPDHKFGIEENLSIIGSLQKLLGVFQRKVISIFEPMDSIVSQIKRYKPFVLWSTPSVVQLLAQELERTNKKLHIPLLVLMAETISDDQIELFKNRISANYLDIYGCMESPSMSFSYNTTNHKNIVSNSTYVEVVNERNLHDQHVGDIVITNLINKVMPIIRYDLGDYVEVMDSVDFPAKRIGKIHGRKNDIIYFGDNYQLAFHHVYQMFHRFSECEQYKFVQKSTGELVLQLKVTPSADKGSVAEKAKAKWDKNYPTYPLVIEWKDRLPLNPKTGKYKVIEKELTK